MSVGEKKTHLDEHGHKMFGLVQITHTTQTRALNRHLSHCCVFARDAWDDLCIYVCICVYVCVFLCVYVCVCMYVYFCVCMYVCVCICVCIVLYCIVCVCYHGVDDGEDGGGELVKPLVRQHLSHHSQTPHTGLRVVLLSW